MSAAIPTLDLVLREASLGTAESLLVAVRAAECLPADHEVLDPAADAAATVSDIAVAIGIEALSRGEDRRVANEFFRIAFYRSERSLAAARNDLHALFLANRALAPLDKWIHYFDVYERHLARFRDSAPRVLEIGVFRGGGLLLMQRYLGDDATIVGIDIDDSARRAAQPAFEVEIGDQADPAFLEEVARRHGPFDVVIDDGGHMVSQQVASLEVLLPHVRPGGVYLVEDCHTSYWPDYVDLPESFIEFAKHRVDDLNAFHREPFAGTSSWTSLVDGIHFHDSIVVFDRADRLPPFCEVAGVGSALLDDREAMIDEAHVQTITVGLTREIESARDGIRAAKAERDAVLGTVADRDAALAELYASRSWRLTRLLRWVAGGLAPDGRRRATPVTNSSGSGHD